MGIREDLEACREAMLTRTGYEVREMHLSSALLISMYRGGYLRPDDESITVWLTDGAAGVKAVEEFLKTFSPS